MPSVIVKDMGSMKMGDKIFLFCDVDTKDKRKQLLNDNIIEKAKTRHALILFSNPSFEIWLLNHFRRTTKVYLSQEEVIRDLKHYIRDYEKNKDVFPTLNNRLQIAIENSKMQLSKGCCLEQENAGTDVFRLIELLMKK